MDTRHAQTVGAQADAVSHAVEGGVPELVIADVAGRVVGLVVQTVSDHLAGEILDNVFIVVGVAVDDQRAVGGELLSE